MCSGRLRFLPIQHSSGFPVAPIMADEQGVGPDGAQYQFVRQMIRKVEQLIKQRIMTAFAHRNCFLHMP
jgi:hypothetical protein